MFQVLGRPTEPQPTLLAVSLCHLGELGPPLSPDKEIFIPFPKIKPILVLGRSVQGVMGCRMTHGTNTATPLHNPARASCTQKLFPEILLGLKLWLNRSWDLQRSQRSGKLNGRKGTCSTCVQGKRQCRECQPLSGGTGAWTGGHGTDGCGQGNQGERHTGSCQEINGAAQQIKPTLGTELTPRDSTSGAGVEIPAQS